MRRFLAVLIFAFCAAAMAQVNLTPSMTTAQIQSALNGATSGEAVNWAAGTYSITTQINMPCSNLQMTGPVANPPTAILDATFTGSVILAYPGSCANMGSVEYLHFENTGAVYVGYSSGNLTFEHNLVTGLPSSSSGNYSASESGVFLDGQLNPSTTTSNVTIEYNYFGDANSCSAVFAVNTDSGGYCAGVFTHTGEDLNLTIEYNTFYHVEEGIKIGQLATYNPGTENSVCVGCTIEYNNIQNFHRIGTEIQTAVPNTTGNVLAFQHNVIQDPISSFYGTFLLSAACCEGSGFIQSDGQSASPADTLNDNVLIATLPIGTECPPYGVEFWGDGAQGNNDLVQGTVCNGFTWGYGAAPWEIVNSYICGNMGTSSGSGYITNEEGQSNPPAQSGNTTSTTCAATVSHVPSIEPVSGSCSGPVTVTISDSGTNTSIWYTTDGSQPVPGQGTATLYTGPFSAACPSTVNAVGMWGTANQPTSYPAGYGYVPSSVQSRTYSGSSSPTLTSVYLGNTGSVNTLAIGATVQMQAYCVYSSGTSPLNCTTTDANGSKVTSWLTSNSLVAQISSTGLVTGQSAGTANVQAVVNTTVYSSDWGFTVGSSGGMTLNSVILTGVLTQ